MIRVIIISPAASRSAVQVLTSTPRATTTTLYGGPREAARHGPARRAPGRLCGTLRREVCAARPRVYGLLAQRSALTSLLGDPQTALDGLTHAPEEPPKDLDIHTPAEKGEAAFPRLGPDMAVPLGLISPTVAQASSTAGCNRLFRGSSTSPPSITSETTS